MPGGSKGAGIEANLGVATGRVYCGTVGSAGSRCEFAVIGDSVNMAARLMGKSKNYGGVLIDKTMYATAARNVIGTSVASFLCWRVAPRYSASS